VTRETEVPAALLEFLFLSNDADAAVLVDRSAHELLAAHVAKAIDVFMTERGDG
jgi:N-acetylmuramoyl-L-alanine amidase